MKSRALVPTPTAAPPLTVAALLFLTLLCTIAPPVQSQETRETEADAPVARTFTGETTVTLVEVPVRVLRRGEPVEGLSADDFRIFDGDEERQVLAVERVDLRTSAVGGGAAAPSPAARRHFLLLYDMAFTDPPYLRKAVAAGRDLVRNGLHESDLVGVAIFNMRAGLSEVVGFTPDHDQALAALDELGAFLGDEDAERAVAERRRVAGLAGEAEGEATAQAPDPLNLRVGEWEARIEDVGMSAEREISDGLHAAQVALGTGERGAGGIDSAVAIGEPNMAEIRKTEASAMVRTLGDLADAMRWVDGAKYLVLFSRGFEGSYAVGQNSSWLLDDLDAAVEKFRRAGWSIHSIETTGDLTTPNRRARRDALFFLADETGGDLIENTLDLSQAMGKVLNETNLTYVLTFESPPLPADGSFRELRVELAPGAEAPDGSRVFHRAGYFTPKPFGEMAVEERRLATAELLLAGNEIDEVGCRVLVSPAEVLPSGRMRVPVVLDVNAVSLLASRNWQATRVQALAYAFDAAGRVAGSWGRDYFLTPNVVMKAARAGSLVFYGDLELPAGEYEVRSVVRSVEDGRVTLRKSALRVPGEVTEAPILLQPIFAEMVKEGAEETDSRIMIRDVTLGSEYPFAFGERRFLPALDPAFVRSGETTLIGRGIWSDAPTGLRALVFDSNGFPVPGGVVVRLLGATPPAETGGPQVRQIALGFAPRELPPGDYELRLVAPAPGGETVSSPPAAFRVVESTTEMN